MQISSRLRVIVILTFCVTGYAYGTSSSSLAVNATFSPSRSIFLTPTTSQTISISLSETRSTRHGLAQWTNSSSVIIAVGATTLPSKDHVPQTIFDMALTSGSSTIASVTLDASSRSGPELSRTSTYTTDVFRLGIAAIETINRSVALSVNTTFRKIESATRTTLDTSLLRVLNSTRTTPSTNTSMSTASIAYSVSESSSSSSSLSASSTGSALSCPVTSYASGLSPKILDLSGCAYETAWPKDQWYYYYEDRCLAQYCRSSLYSEFDAYTGPIPTMTTTLTIMNISWDGVTVTGFGPLETLTMSWNGTADNVVRREEPCCGACTMRLKQLNIFYWQDQVTAASGSVPSLENIGAVPGTPESYVNEEGFTFISPSVYIAMTSLRGWNSCGPVGPVVFSTTLAFDAEEISTLSHLQIHSSCSGGGWFLSTTITRRMTFADLHQDCSTLPGYFYNPDFPFMYWMTADPCHP
ncbi:hypothetical protein BKA66DRAFT_68805 [Pyrenochaeta sp. MPI-SDFR-AT-0127]|nr:hypothetical protein BKA66DRAFT_68805 [Pyrenochaeta sp. MPI-SDFR-AT-0127]